MHYEIANHSASAWHEMQITTALIKPKIARSDVLYWVTTSTCILLTVRGPSYADVWRWYFFLFLDIVTEVENNLELYVYASNNTENLLKVCNEYGHEMWNTADLSTFIFFLHRNARFFKLRIDECVWIDYGFQ